MSTKYTRSIVVPQTDFDALNLKFDQGASRLFLKGVDGTTTVIRKEGKLVEVETGRQVYGMNDILELSGDKPATIMPNTGLGLLATLCMLQNKDFTCKMTERGFEFTKKKE